MLQVPSTSSCNTKSCEVHPVSADELLCSVEELVCPADELLCSVEELVCPADELSFSTDESLCSCFADELSLSVDSLFWFTDELSCAWLWLWLSDELLPPLPHPIKESAVINDKHHNRIFFMVFLQSLIYTFLAEPSA